jgi:hypothetical protein
MNLFRATTHHFMDKITQYPKYRDLGWTGAGNAPWMLHRNDEALETHRNAIDSNPKYFDAICNYAVLTESLNRNDKVAWVYQRLLTLSLTPELFPAARRPPRPTVSDAFSRPS